MKFEPYVTIKEMERRMVIGALEYCSGDKNVAARMLGISRKSIDNKLKLFGEAARFAKYKKGDPVGVAPCQVTRQIVDRLAEREAGESILPLGKGA